MGPSGKCILAFHRTFRWLRSSEVAGGGLIRSISRVTLNTTARSAQGAPPQTCRGLGPERFPCAVVACACSFACRVEWQSSPLAT